MNRLLPYEQLLAERIEQVSANGMADAIWYKIEQELNKDGSGDSGQEPPASPQAGKSSFSNFYLYTGSCLIIATILLIYLITRKEKEPALQALPGINKPLKEVKNIDSIDSVQPLLPKTNSLIPYNPAWEKQSVPDFFVTPYPGNDSLSSEPVNSKADSVPANRQPTITIRNLPDSSTLQNNPSPQKARGIKGISDEDYKIKTVKKDSTR